MSYLFLWLGLIIESQLYSLAEHFHRLHTHTNFILVITTLIYYLIGIHYCFVRGTWAEPFGASSDIIYKTSFDHNQFKNYSYIL